jgi:hypothetical protein
MTANDLMPAPVASDMTGGGKKSSRKGSKKGGKKSSRKTKRTTRKRCGGKKRKTHNKRR